jgi:hypothetical protein
MSSRSLMSGTFEHTFTPTSALACSSGKKRKQRNVRIMEDRNEYHAIAHIKEMSKVDVKATWYTAEEFAATKKTFIPIIQVLSRGETLAETNHQTARGLEFRTRQGAQRRQRNKVRASTAVLLEQQRLVDANIYMDDIGLADVYRSFSSVCRAVALQRGLKDEKCVENYRKEDEASGQEEPQGEGRQTRSRGRSNSFSRKLVSRSSSLSTPSRDYNRKSVSRSNSMSRTMGKFFKQVRGNQQNLNDLSCAKTEAAMAGRIMQTA